MQDYFQVLGVERAFNLDVRELESKYFSLQRTHHPDKSSAEDSTYSSSINYAYQVLKDPMKRAEHIYALHGLNVELLSTNQEFNLYLMGLYQDESLTKDVVLSLIEKKWCMMLDYFVLGDVQVAFSTFAEIKALDRLLERRFEF